MPISDEQAAIHVQDLITWCLNHSNCELHVDHLGKLRDTIKQNSLLVSRRLVLLTFSKHNICNLGSLLLLTCTEVVVGAY